MPGIHEVGRDAATDAEGELSAAKARLLRLRTGPTHVNLLAV